MAKVRYSKRAVEDLANIWDYTYDEWSERQADKYYMILIHACQEIALDSKKGKPYEEVAEGIHGFLIYRHIILFKRLTAAEILVVRILHAQMNLKAKSLSKPPITHALRQPGSWWFYQKLGYV